MNNVLYANFTAGRRTTQTESLFQYDYGQVLRITGVGLPKSYEVHFGANRSGETILTMGGEMGVPIPDSLLLSAGNFYAWLFLHSGEDDGETEYCITIPVQGRGKLPGGAPPTPPAVRARVTSLDATALASDPVIEAVGIPQYVSDAAQLAVYALTDPGWYVFARIEPKQGTAVSSPAVTGADGCVLAEDHVDVAVRFGAAAVSRPVTVDWGPYAETFVFKATDLAVRNLDYRATFYIYDVSPFAEWTFALTADAAFAAGTHYYTLADGVYTEAVEGTDWTAGDAVPADTYYVHSALTLAGMTPNVTYKLDAVVDCPITIVLPEIPEDGHGAWFEVQLRYKGTYSCTLLPPEGVKVGTATTQAQSGGMNTIDLQYTDVDGVKMWTLLNTHSNIPA